MGTLDRAVESCILATETSMTDSLEQAVARTLQEIPHAPTCQNWRGGTIWPCTCDREQRIAARVAAFGEAIYDHCYALDPTSPRRTAALADGVRALSPQEEPNR